jgi:L-asparaginase
MSQSSSLPHILILATGGTIAGKAGDALHAEYQPGQIAIEDYLAEVAKLPTRL